MNQALPSESYIARLDYLAFNGKVCSSVAWRIIFQIISWS